MCLCCDTVWHDDVNKWKHLPRHWPSVRGIHRSPVNSPHKGQWGGSLMFSLIYAWINNWVNNRDAGDLTRHRAHCDVIVMNWMTIERNIQGPSCYPNTIALVLSSWLSYTHWHRSNRLLRYFRFCQYPFFLLIMVRCSVRYDAMKVLLIPRPSDSSEVPKLHQNNRTIILMVARKL